MRLVCKIASAVVAVAAVSCGVAQDSAKQEKPSVEEQSTEVATIDEVDARPATMPGMVVVKVKEDAHGEVLSGSENAEMRISDAAVSSLDSNSIESVFAAADQASANSDNLDADSSEGQYYWGWRGRRWNRWGWGGYGYNRYRPFYYYRGFGYGYRYYNAYRWGCFRYYCYW